MSENKGLAFAVAGFSLVIIAGFLFFTTNNNAKAKTVKLDVKTTQRDIDRVHNNTKAYTVESVLAKMKSKQTNVNSEINELTSKIKTNIYELYSVKTQVAYDDMQSKLKKDLGTTFADKLIELDKPNVSQSGIPQFTYAKASNVQVAYDKLDLDDDEMNVYVTVDYTTPEISTAGSGKEATTITNNGQDFFALTFNTKNKSLNLVEYKEGVKRNV